MADARSAPTITARLHDTFPARWFDVAAPEPDAYSVGVPGPATAKPTPTCTPGEVAALARTRRTATGVVGVIKLVSHGCALDLTHRTLRLRSRSGDVLDVPDVVHHVAVNPGRTLGGGDFHEIYGFAWRGSWCGPRPESVVVSLHGGPAAVPLVGPAPRCRGSSGSVIDEGAISGYRMFAVEPSPPAWRHLRLKLAVAPETSGLVLRDLVVRISNSSRRHAVALSPRPTYFIDAGDAGGENGGVVTAPLPVTKRTERVPAGGSVSIRLPDATYPYALRPAFRKHHKVTVSIYIAGVPTASAVTHVP